MSLMICPKAKDGSCPVRLEARYKHCNIHCHEESCNHPFAFSGQVACPACVEVEPQQEVHAGDEVYSPELGRGIVIPSQPSQVQEKQCPECGHMLNMHINGECKEYHAVKGHCGCTYSGNQQPAPTLREHFHKVIDQLMKHGWAACPPDKRCADAEWNRNENTCTDCFVDALESAVKADPHWKED